MRVDARSLGIFVLRAFVVPTLLALSSSSGAEAQSGFAGTYRASPQRIEAVVTTWGEDCGPKPQSTVDNAQPSVVVTDVGSHLSLRFPDRTLRTDTCWSPNTAIKLVSSTVVNKRYQAECKTAVGDAKREQGRYVIVASVGQLELTEESQYDWQLKASHCVAKVKMTQTLTSGNKPLVDASVPDAALPDAKVAEVVEPEPVETGCVPGAPTRLRLRPAESRIAPGDRVCFSARAFDAKGCAINVVEGKLDFRLTRPSGAEGVLVGNCFRAAGNAALAEGQFKISVSQDGLKADATITVSAPDLSDITARRGPSSSGSVGQGAADRETVLESGIRAVASGSHGLLWLGLSVAGLAAVLSIVAIVGLRVVRRRAATAQPSFPEPAQQRPPSVPVAPAVRVETPAIPAQPPQPTGAGGQRICPQCRRGYAPGTDRCTSDGTQLVDYADFVKQAEPKAAFRHCPECGGKLAADSVFCGSCGHKVAH